MHLVVTRPADQAHDWVRRLREAGVPALALPLIGIEPVDNPAGLHREWRRLPERALVMFVSANAVQQFFARRPRDDRWPAGVRAGCTGPGTAAALTRAGVPGDCVVQPPAGGPFDSEGLWSQLATWAWGGRSVLVVRGEAGRDWLADRLLAAGAAVDFVAAYRRVPGRLDTLEARAVLRMAVAQPDQLVWHFSSSEAVGHLQRAAGPAGPNGPEEPGGGRGVGMTASPAPDWARSQALATHPRIAEAVRKLGFGRVELLDVGLDALVAWWRRHAPSA